ncbi:MAG: multicopper oxidase domain-containing protein [Acidobacteriota bacterium]
MPPRIGIAVLLVALSSPLRASAPDVAANDNRTPAGEWRNRVLTLRLEAVAGIWRPELEQGPVREIYAFAEEGKAPQNPGPLIRVAEGTELHVSVRNRLPEPLKMHGLLQRPADADAFVDIAPGAVHEFTFKAGAPGTYFYWGRTSDIAFNQRRGADSQLNGAFVVDSSRGRTVDRVFVMTEWFGPVVPTGMPRKVSLAINGRSWPHTERLTLPFGEAVEWRVINATVAPHPMHLHGTFYTVESRGFAVRDVTYGSESRRLATTELMEPGTTMMMRWVPDRVGNWLFHCHILAHVSGDMRRGDMPAGAHHEDHAEHDPQSAMAGLVLGIFVQPGDETAAPDLEMHERRRMTLYLRNIPARYGAEPGYAFALVEGHAPEPPVTSDAPPSPVIVVAKGQPVAIRVVNRLAEDTAIHWHGIELESFHDGVPGWSGHSGQVMPPMKPGGTFDVHFTPPRAGTFIYHTHSHGSRQLVGGLYGPLIVLEPGQTFDPATDRIVLIGGAGPGVPAVEMNRSTNPQPAELKVGVKHRFRLINITPNSSVRVTLRGDTGPVQWRAISKDGADLPPNQATSRVARQVLGVGETYDFEYEPAAPGELVLEASRGTMTSMLLRVVR